MYGFIDSLLVDGFENGHQRRGTECLSYLTYIRKGSSVVMVNFLIDLQGI